MFSLTTTGALLRTDRPDSMASFVRMFNDPPWCARGSTWRTACGPGQPSFDAVFGKDFAHLKDDAELSAEFNAAMSQGTRGRRVPA